jgi:hypothetical protein
MISYLISLYYKIGYESSNSSVISPHGGDLYLVLLVGGGGLGVDSWLIFDSWLLITFSVIRE